MRKVAEAVNTYLSSFGLPAYTMETVPEGAELPYITYGLSEPEWSSKASMYAQVWDRTKSNAGIIDVSDQIIRDIGIGKKLPIDGGYVVIWPETPMQQLMVDGDFRSVYMNFSVNVYHKAGS